MKTLYCVGKGYEHVAIVPRKIYILTVAILYVSNLISDVKNFTCSMMKSSNKKCLKKDIFKKKIQGNSKHCKQHGDSNCEDSYIFGPICTNKFYKTYT